jgi:hypothetical protein
MFLPAAVLTELQMIQQSSGANTLIETAIANGGVGAVMFTVWWLTFKSMQRQFQFALKQNQEQFEKALTQIEKQHKENLEQNLRTVNWLMDMIKKENEYKEILTGVLTEMKNALTIHINQHGE